MPPSRSGSRCSATPCSSHASAGGCAPLAVRVARLLADATGDHGRRQALMETAGSERWWWGTLLLSLALPVALLVHGSARPLLHAIANAPALEDFGVVPDFTLTERSGLALSRADLAGAPWVADFVYTQCQGTCPLLSAKMAKLERRVAPDVRLVSFSV